jgi:type IV pilus assembly protein PilM
VEGERKCPVRWFPVYARRLTPIGIDVGGSSIKAAQLSRTREGYQLDAAIVLPRPEPVEELDLTTTLRLRQVLLEKGFKGRSIVLGVPGHRLESEVLDLPARTNAPIDALLRAELHRLHELDADSFEMAHWRLPSAAQNDAATSSVMAVAAPSVDLERLMDVFEDAGFHVQAIDAPCCAIARACREMISRCDLTKHDIRPGVNVILDLGSDATLLVMTHDDEVLHQRVLTGLSGLGLRKAVVERFGLSAEIAEELLKEACIDASHTARPESVHAAWTRNLMVRHADILASEVKKAVCEALGRHPKLRLARVILSGGGAHTLGMDVYLGARFATETLVARPRDLVRCPAALTNLGAMPMLACAIGLARWGE